MKRHVCFRLGLIVALIAFFSVVVSSRAAFAATASLSVSPSSGAPGATVQVSGAGFAAVEVVNVIWCATSDCQSSTSLGSVTTDKNGAFGGAAGMPPLTTIVPSSAVVGTTYTIAGIGATSGATASTSFTAVTAAGQPVYYLSLGDSLAQGQQPNSSGMQSDTTQGYVDDVYQYYLANTPNLQMMKMGCPGETTGSMISGGHCGYSLGSQLAQAVNFLSTHSVAMVTIDIGANNIVPCFGTSSINQSCVNRGTSTVQQQVPTILLQLQQADGSTVPIYAMNYYDPYLHYWFLGKSGQTLARQSEQDIVTFNSMLGQVYGNAGVSVADVQTTFQTTNFNVIPPSTLPVNVTTICNWTWMCGPGPGTPSIHANAAGYGEIASTFEGVIGPAKR